MSNDTRDDYEKGYDEGRGEGQEDVLNLLAEMVLREDFPLVAQDRLIRQFRDRIRYRLEQIKMGER